MKTDGLRAQWFPILMFLYLPGYALAEHSHGELEEIVVSAPFQRKEAETALPVNVLSGERLRKEVGNTLGDTLGNQPGVTSSSFGSGVGLPVIRGLSGNRVQVMQDGISALDASAVSPDHSNGVEAILAERIEVVRGPATLLYGNGAIGGVVNVMDNRIPDDLPAKPTFIFEQRHDSVSDQDTSVVRFDSAAGPLAFHVDGLYRDSNNIEVPGSPINLSVIDVDNDELMESYGHIPNSNLRAHSQTGGLSYVGTNGYVGYSVSRLENDYGLPPGAHGHEEGHEEGNEDASEEDEFVRVAMEQTRQDIKGEYRFTGGVFERLEARLTHNDYRHQEIEEGSNGTMFKNEGFEGRFTLTHAPRLGWQGIWGLQLTDRDFSAVGEEAFIPPSEIDSIAIFAVEGYETGTWSFELGARAERQEIDPAGPCGVSETMLSGGISGIREFDGMNLLLSYAHSQRSPTVEEVFSNVHSADCLPPPNDDELILHASTDLFEIGDPELDKERSNNFEVGLRKTAGRVVGNLSLFYNDIQDYIGLTETGRRVDGRAVATYDQKDAVFKGYELELSVPVVTRSGYRVEWSLFSDYVRATFDQGGDVPRVPPLRVGAAIEVAQDQWAVRVRSTRVQRQNHTAANETDTDDYVNLELYADYHWRMGGSRCLAFVKGVNLLDETVRNHTSFVKDIAPEPGRGIELGLRVIY